MIQRGLLSMGLLLALFAGGALPVRAQSASDYAQVAAPDVAVAVDFLRDTMDCDVLDVRDDRALLECGQGSVVEVVRGASRPTASVLRLRTENADAALAWLRRRHVPVIHDRTVDPATPDGLSRVDVRAPWGQTVELVGHTAVSPVGSTPLAAE